MIKLTPKKSIFALCLTASAFVGLAGGAQAQSASSHLEQLMRAQSAPKQVRLSPVRENALKSSAQMLGTQTGLIEMSAKIRNQIEKRKVEMERNFRFGDMVIGQGVLPPVLLHTENAASVEDGALRLAGSIYEIKEPARFFSGAPSWRDWLLMGLPEKDDLPNLPNHEQLLPRDATERAYWEQEMRKAYKNGVEQAKEIFDHNLSKLEEVYTGMRTFYDLYQRDMVSAPVIASSQEIVSQKDENTIVVGDTLFRITMPAEFNLNHEEWKALEARPSLVPPLKGVEQYDDEQIKHAYQTYKEQQARYEAIRKAQAWWRQGGQEQGKEDAAEKKLRLEVAQSAKDLQEKPEVFTIK